MKIDVVTLFPGMFEGMLQESILKIAIQKGLADVRLLNLRDFSPDAKHRKVDAPPYGGGAGMVICAEPVFNAVEYLREHGRSESRLILLTPSGEPYSQAIAGELAEEKGMILLCGHYEGIDERVCTGLQPREISLGDYVLTGGEIPAMALLDSVVRLIPGVLGSSESLCRESFSGGGLEYPHYTRPREFRGMEVPEVLLSGDHQKIEDWRERQARKRTEDRRPDLLEKDRKKGKR